MPESCCKNQEYHVTEYHDGYSDCHIICKISNEVCNEENCNHKELQLDGFTKEEMIEKMAKALCKYEQDCTDCQCRVNTNACRLILSDEGYIARSQSIYERVRYL